MTHDELADDLATHLRTEQRMLWTDMQLGPSGSVRPDVYCIEKSFAHPSVTVYECKVSVSDFRADVTAGKYLNYLKYANAVVFAYPHGMLKDADVPSGVGIMHRSDRGWSTRRRATLRPLDNLPRDAWMKLLIDGLTRERLAERVRQVDVYHAQRRICAKLGKDVFRILHRHENVLQEEAASKARATRMVEDAKQLAAAERRRVAEEAPVQWAQLLEALELPPDAETHRVAMAVRSVCRTAEKAKSECASTQAALKDVSEALERHREVWRWS